MLIRDGIPEKEDIIAVTPPEERFALGPVAIAECYQEIPCNPCTTACVKKAIRVEPDINSRPKVDFSVCNGCGACLFKCPGLAIFIVDKTYSDTEALVKLPFELLPVPEAGQYACGLDRAGNEVGWFKVVKAISGGETNMTWQISLAVPKELAMEVRNIRAGGCRDE